MFSGAIVSGSQADKLCKGYHPAESDIKPWHAKGKDGLNGEET